jgi:hypothetical protein
MKSNPRFALGLVAALGVVAAVLWAVKQGNTPLPDKPATPPPAPHAELPAPASASEDVAPPQAGTPVAVDPPVAPTFDGAGAPKIGVGGPLFIDSADDARKALELTIERMGGRQALEPLRKATYQHFATGDAVQFRGELQHDGVSAIAMRDPGADTAAAAADRACWRTRDGITAPCPKPVHDLLCGLRLLHAATVVLPLLDPPFAVTDSGASEIEGRIVNSIRFQLDGGGEAVLLLDPQELHVLQLEATPKDCQAMRVEFSEHRKLGGAQVPGLRVVHLIDGDLQPLTTLVDRIADLKPGIDAKRFAAPPLTKSVALHKGVRPLLRVVEMPAGSHQGAKDKMTALQEFIGPASRAFGFELHAAYGLPTDAQTLAQGVTLWGVLPPSVHQLPGKVVATVPATEAVLEVARVTEYQVFGRLAGFVKAAQAAGHVASDGRPSLRCLSDPDPKTREITVEFALPVKAK